MGGSGPWAKWVHTQERILVEELSVRDEEVLVRGGFNSVSNFYSVAE